jgi:signal transduction histidine kinase
MMVPDGRQVSGWVHESVGSKPGLWLFVATMAACGAAGAVGFLDVPLLAVGMIGQTAVFAAAMLFQDKRRRRAEEQADARETELRTAYDHIRDIGARFLDAQESERSRIARELHDDIGQQLALLATNLRLSGDSEETVAQIDSVARSVREMSHRLHPAMLQLMGLIESVRSLQREHARSGVAIDFTHRDVPRELPAAVSLCLFRVIQEALQNAIKHGHARHVSIDVRRTDNAWMVTVADDGRGFEVHAACGKGLGLISIVERTEAHGGSVVVRSKPGAGTRVEAHVPVNGHVGHPLTRPVLPSNLYQNTGHSVC